MVELTRWQKFVAAIKDNFVLMILVVYMMLVLKDFQIQLTMYSALGTFDWKALGLSMVMNATVLLVGIFQKAVSAATGKKVDDITTIASALQTGIIKLMNAAATSTRTGLALPGKLSLRVPCSEMPRGYNASITGQTGILVDRRLRGSLRQAGFISKMLVVLRYESLRWFLWALIKRMPER